MGRREVGRSGEDAAAAWYEARGYRVLDRNWRCREGELDLVVSKGRVLVFCEVKARSSRAFMAPAEAVTATKVRRLRQLAMRWLDQSTVRAPELRFDVASVVGDQVEVIEAAF